MEDLSKDRDRAEPSDARRQLRCRHDWRRNGSRPESSLRCFAKPAELQTRPPSHIAIFALCPPSPCTLPYSIIPHPLPAAPIRSNEAPLPVTRAWSTAGARHGGRRCDSRNIAHIPHRGRRVEYVRPSSPPGPYRCKLSIEYRILISDLLFLYQETSPRLQPGEKRSLLHHLRMRLKTRTRRSQQRRMRR